MDDVMKKVLAETWVTTGDLGVDREAPAPPIVLLWTSHEGQTDEEAYARARIAACAPEALRLLLETYHPDTFINDDPAEGGVMAKCQFCDIVRRSGDHQPDCRWLALMKKAGLR